MKTNLAFALQQIMLRPGKLELLNTYRGVPVVYPATATAVDEATLTVKVAGYEIICLTLEPMTTLLSPLLEDPARASVLACDVGLGRAILGNIQYTSAHVGDRMVARVAPQAPLPVEVVAGGHTLTGQLADISIVGLGLIVSAAEAAQLRPGSPVNVSLTLPIEPKTPLRLDGAVRSVRPDGSLAEHHRIGIRFASQAQPFIFHQYIRERQGEIARELKALYEQRVSESQ
jgi:hypothetical protein